MTRHAGFIPAVAHKPPSVIMADAVKVEERLKEEASNFGNTVAAKVESLEKEVPKSHETTKVEAAKVEEKTEVTATKEEPKKEAAKVEFNADVEVSGLDEFLIKWGFKEDPRIPEDCRVDPLTRIKESGRAGVVAYALTEGAFWIGSIPVAIATVAFTTGSLPDVSSTEGKEAVAGYVFVFINFARLIVPARIALALAAAPWCDENIVQRFFPPDRSNMPDECEIEE